MYNNILNACTINLLNFVHKYVVQKHLCKIFYNTDCSIRVSLSIIMPEIIDFAKNIANYGIINRNVLK